MAALPPVRMSLAVLMPTLRRQRNRFTRTRKALSRLVATSELRRRPAASGAPRDVTLRAKLSINRGRASMIARPTRMRDAQQKFLVGESSMRSAATQYAMYLRTGTRAEETDPSGPDASMLMSST